MDTGSDFIQPEFLNILFFQQKNLVIFPYVDLKHLHGLEIFTAGYNVVDLESTALHNLKEILEFESSNSYSQNPTLYFIFNVDRAKLKELMELDGIRCIINSNENISNLANGSRFVFFNKKNNQFLNYDLTPKELEFETSLISNSQDEDILQESIQKIKIAATRIFKELNQSGSLETLPDILSEYEKKYWTLILQFTSRYYDINIPDISQVKFKPPKRLKDFSNEYEVLISTNRAIGKEFIQILHDYRSKKVNPAHLELDELYNPQKLYGYLRNHHWKDGIPKKFVEEWYQMNISNYKLTEDDQIDFEKIVRKVGLEFHVSEPLSPEPPLDEIDGELRAPILPSPRTAWNKYKKWIDNQIAKLENLDSTILSSSGNLSFLVKELSELITLLGQYHDKDDVKVHGNRKIQIMVERITREVTTGLNRVKIAYWIELYGLKDRFQFVVRFIAQLKNFLEIVLSKDDNKDMPSKIKEFSFPEDLERDLIRFNMIRNDISHDEISLQQIESILSKNGNWLNKIYLDFLTYLMRQCIINVVRKFNSINSHEIIPIVNNFVLEKYFKNGTFTSKEMTKVSNYLSKKT